MTEDSAHTDVATLYQATVYSTDGDKIGRVGTVYLDDLTGRPSWVTVRTGLFGTSESFVPLDSARMNGTEIVVPYPEDQVKDAPRMETDAQLSPEEEERLYVHYGLASAGAVDEETATGAAGGRGAGHDVPGPDTDDAMTRSEERLRVGLVQREAGRARLRKHVVAEQVSASVPVRREELVVERESIPASGDEAATSGLELSEEEHVIILHEEEAVTRKETVPVERVRVGTEEVTGQQTVTGEVRAERIDLETDPGVDVTRTRD